MPGENLYLGGGGVTTEDDLHRHEGYASRNNYSSASDSALDNIMRFIFAFIMTAIAVAIFVAIFAVIVGVPFTIFNTIRAFFKRKGDSRTDMIAKQIDKNLRR